MKNASKASSIKDIARALGFSIGTVDRALHGRPGVSLKTKARVLQMAEQLEYKPNLAVQALKLNRRIEIAIVLPKHISHFFDPLRAGIQAAADATVGLHIKVTFLEYMRLGQGDAELLESTLKGTYDGIIFTPGNPRKILSNYSPSVQTGYRDALRCKRCARKRSDRVRFCARVYERGAGRGTSGTQAIP